ncbi:prepilin peptidase [Infirmifilum lucidum]|uniref:Prepilin peptidase n=1 Tax=Infirmifilum lucidum TaxID=2776706 RepID=A0A7L9FI92_9CREN|nr:prepilin peptidase [Infirmifilum lucidum]QOJ79510.1 prepilin peptidase [Infirmifilum lucidum]
MPGLLPYVDTLRTLAVLLTLAAAGYSDYRRREVDDKVWITGFSVATPLLLARLNTVNLELYTVSLLLTASISLLVWKLKLMGDADAIALFFIGSLEPPSTRNFLTLVPLASIVTIAGLASLVYVIYNVAVNIARKPRFDSNASLLEKILAYTTMRFVTPEEYYSKSYMYILPGDAGAGVPTPEPGEKQSLAHEGFWVTVGLPYVTLLFIGYLFYLAIARPLPL